MDVENYTYIREAIADLFLSIFVARGKEKEREKYDKSEVLPSGVWGHHKVGCGFVVKLRRGKWNGLTGHPKDCGKNWPNSRLNSFRQGENDVVGNIRKLAPASFNKEDANSRVNSLQPGEDDVDRDAWEVMRKKRRGAKVEPPWRMVTCSQTKAVAEDQK